MKKTFFYILMFVCLLGSFGTAQAQGSWNLVWREDFGVVEDTVIRDFADNSKHIVDHTFAGNGQDGDCSQINDMYYGIVNSTLWAIKRHKRCNKDANWFMAGRDHTGNEKGAMLLVNVGNNSLDKTIYEQEINFDLCQNSHYRFVIYASSITHPEFCDGNPTKANLTMNVYNVKNSANPIIVKTFETSDIPLWEMPVTGNGSVDWGTTGQGFASPFAERNWSEYQVEFIAGDGDKLKLEVVNHKNGGCGNDFVIDDISLYRYDELQVIDPTISTNTVSQESTTSASGCAFLARFSVPSDVLDSWKNIYTQVYFLWQRSRDDGVNWINLPEPVSGIDKNNIEWEVPTGVREVYRVIITGATSDVDAKAEAEYIAEHGGPSNGCSYFSISNTLAGVSPEPDCSYKDDLKTIWKEDFGTAQIDEYKKSSDIKLNFHQNSGSDCFKEGEYIIASATDSIKKSWEEYGYWDPELGNVNVTKYAYCNEPTISDYSGLQNGAMLYACLGQNSNLIFEKELSGPFCPCKSYIFSFVSKALGTWKTQKYLLKVVGASGNILGENEVEIWGSDPAPGWSRSMVSFEIPSGYSGKIYLQVFNNRGADWNRVIFDDFRVSICQEKVPQASLAIDNTPSLKYLSNFDCAVTPPHMVNLSGLDAWASEYPNYGYVWQMSVNGGATWTTISENTQVHYCDDLEDGETLYRVVVGENATVAQQVATNGKPNDACATYFITNMVGLNCKGVSCTKPAAVSIVSSDTDDVLCPDGTTTLSVSEATTVAGTFDYLWFKDEIGDDADAVDIAHDNTSTTMVTYNNAGTYILLVRDATYPTAQKCWQRAEIELTKAESPALKSLTGGAEFCYGKQTMPQILYTFEKGEPPYKFTYRVSANGVENNTARTLPATETTFSPPAPSITDGTIQNKFIYTLVRLEDSYGCVASPSTLSTAITVNPNPTAVISDIAPVCEGSDVALSGSSNLTGVSYEWTKGDARTAVSTSQNPTLTDVSLADAQTYYLTTRTLKCSSTEASKNVVIYKKPIITEVKAEPEEVCSGSDITFSATIDNVGEGTPSYSWTGTSSGSSETLTVAKNVTSETTVTEQLTYTMAYTSTLSCSATSEEVSAIVHKIPDAPDVSLWDNPVEYCKGAVAEQLSAVGENLTWYLPDGTTTTVAPTPPTNVANKTYTYQVTQTVNDCESPKATITVVVHPLPTPVITPSKTEVCAGVEAITLELNGVTYASQTWTGANTNVLSNPTAKAPVIAKTTAAGTYTFGVTVVDENNCEASAAETQTITIFKKPTASIAATESGICNLTSTNVVATVSEPNGTGTWTNAVADEGSETSAKFTASTVGAAVVKYVYTSEHECKSDEATTTIQVYAIPAKPVVANKHPQYCVGKIASQLNASTASPTATLTWYNSTMEELNVAPTPSTNSDGVQQYFVRQTDNGCASDTAKIEVTVFALPNPTITADADAVCKGTNIALSTEEYSKYTWDDGANGYILNATKQNATLATPTITTSTFTVGLVVTDGNNCSNTVPIEKTFTIYPIPQVTISAQPSEICNLTTTELTANVSEDGTGVWTNAVEDENSETKALFTASQTGTHEVSYVYTSTHNCVSSVAKTNIIVHTIPVKPTVADKHISYCVNAATSPLVAVATTSTATLAWFDGEGSALNEAPTPSSTSAATMVYSAKQIDNGCASDTAKITVTIHPLPEPVISVATHSACKGTPVQLGTNGVSYSSQLWTYTPSTVKVLSDQTIPAPVLLPTTPAETYSINVEVTDENGCKKTSEAVTVVIHPIPTATISIDEKVCVDGEMKTALVESVSPTGGTGRFSASGTGVIDEATGVFNPASSGVGDFTISYEYTAQESEGSCTTTTPATANIKVLAKPTLTLTPSKSDVCESGTNSNPVTMAVTASPENGTSLFSCETTTIDAATGTLVPSSENIGSHVITFTYTDEDNCVNEVSKLVTVHSLPHVEFLPENPSEICVKAEPITLAVSPTGTNGTFSGAVLSSEFNPSIVGAGDNQKITYKYVDEFECTNTAQHTISVVSVPKPTVDGGVNKMIVRGSDGNLSAEPNLTAIISASGDGIIWQRGETNESTESEFITGLSKTSPEGSYPFNLVETREISSGTCYSDNVVATVVISDCPAKTPIANNVYYCVNEDATVVLTATPAEGTLATGNKISWFEFNPTGSRDENAADAAWDNKLSLSLPSYDKSVPSERTIYVAEYDSEHGCWSGGLPVMIKVIANPVVTFEAPEHVCVADGAVTFKMTPATGILHNITGVAGFDADLKQWDPSAAIGTKNSVKCPIQYTVVEDHVFGTVTKQCQTIAAKQVTAHAVKPPTTADKTWLIDEISLIPDDFMSATTVSTGKTITWYGNEQKSTILNEPNTKAFTPNREELQTEVEGRSSYVKSYWVSQTDNYGCESDLVEAKLDLRDCPWNAPTAEPIVACQFDESMPAFTASTDVTAIGDNPTEWLWYEPDGVTSHSVADDNGTSSFAHGITAENEIVQTYFVSYKAKVAAVNDRECESPKSPVTITVNKAPDIKMNDTLLCYADGSRTLSAIVNGVKSTGITEGSWSWNVVGKTGGIDALTGIFDPTFEDDEQTSETDRDHSYQITYSYTDTKNCSFEKTIRVDVEYAQTPTVTEHKGIVTKPDPVVVFANNIESTKDYNVNWFFAKSASTIASNDNPWTITDIDPTQKTTRSYWISQTVNGCESERVEQKVSIVDCPYGKPTAEGQTVCVNGTLTDISASTNEATPAKWIWYNADGSVIANEETNTYHHSVSVEEAGTTMFSVSYLATEPQSGELCESQKAQVSLVVLPLPTIVLDDRLICYNEGNVLMNVSQLDFHENGPGSGLWSVENEPTAINETSGIFRSDFKEHTTGEYTVRYTYKDGKECENSASMTLTVQYVPEPVLTGHTSIVTENSAPQLSAQVLDGAEVNWFNSEVESFSSNHSLIWNVGLAGNMPTEHTFYASQTLNGCESEKASVDVLVVECPFKAPVVEDVKACMGDDDVADLEASTSVAVQEWEWFTAEKQKVSNTSSSFAHAVSSSAVDTVGFYVNYVAVEPTTLRTCPSEMAYAQVIILPLPEITLDEDNPSVVCYDQNDAVFDASVNVHKNGVGAGSWSIVNYPNAMHPASGSLDPTFNGKVTDTYTVNYNYADAWGCTNSAQQSVLIRFVPTPSLSNHYALVTENRPVSLEGLNLVENATMRWYARSDDMRIASTNNPWTTPDKGSIVTNKTYYASQFVDGCESERNSTTVEIIPCPVPNVTIESASVCVYESAPELHITLGDWANRNDKSVVRVYDSEGALLETLNQDNLVFTPSLSKAGTYSFYAEEYNAQPLEGIMAGCASPARVKSTVVVKDVLPPTLRVGEPVCYGDEQTPECVALGVGELSWFEEDPGDYYKNNLSVSQYAIGTKYNPLDNSVGTHPIWVLRYDDGCYSKAVKGEYTVKPRPEAPSTEGEEVCYTGSLLSNSVRVTSDVEKNSFVTWYLTAEKQGGIGLGVGTKYVPYVESPGEYTYYAAVTSDGCEGETSPATLLVKELPHSPQIVGPNQVCTYEDAPTLKANGENITWYSSDKTTVLSNDEVMQITDMSPSTRVFYISQTMNGCEGPLTIFVLNINSQPTAPNPIGASICAGNKNIPTLSTNLSIDKWYADEETTKYLTTGYTFTPDTSIVGNNDVTFYVVREQRGCVSEKVPVTLRVIHKPTFSIGEDTIICEYDSALTIQATAFVPPITESSFVGWSIANGKKSTAYLDTEDHKLVPEATKNPGEYVVKAFYRYKYDNVSCNSDTVSMKYTVKKRARTPIVFTKVICHGDEIKDLQALGSPDMTWNSLDNIAPPTMRGPKYKFTSQQMLDTGTYRFEIFDIDYYDEEHGCVSLADTISLTVAPGAKTKLFGVDSVCVGTTESYYTQYTPASTYYWDVKGDNLNYSKDAMSSSVRYVDWTHAGYDTLTVYEQTWAGCEGFDTLFVKVVEKPIASFTWSIPGLRNVAELVNTSVQDSLWRKVGDSLVAEPVTYSMLWNFGHQNETLDMIDAVIPYEQRKLPILEEDYSYGYNCPMLTVENSFGCRDTYTECFFINSSSALYIPDIFAPANPALGVRTFAPKGFNLKTCEVAVFDHWGNMIWYSNEVRDGMFVGEWDGRYNGKMMEAGVYVWKIEATFIDGKVWDGVEVGRGKKKRYGNVVLMR